MQISIQTQKNKKKPIRKDQQSDQSHGENEDYLDDLEQQKNYDQINREKRVKRLTQVNRELLETLKQQNQILTKHINKQRLKPNKSASNNKNQSNAKEIEKVKKELENVYKQIDMYKNALQILKAKQTSTDAVERLNQMQNKIRVEDINIEQLQRQLKYIAGTREQQQKQLKLFDNDEIKNSLKQLEEENIRLKDAIKKFKKIDQKKDQISKKQQAYQIVLEITLRKNNDEYYPGKEDKKKQQILSQASQIQWKNLIDNLQSLKKNHSQNLDKVELMNKRKLKQIKSYQENQLKLKQKMRTLQTLRSKVIEMRKLATMRDVRKTSAKGLTQQSPLGMRNSIDILPELPSKKKEKITINLDINRQVKKWIVPLGYCVEKGKIMPDSIFFSDKTTLANSKKNKITKIYVWVDINGKPAIVQFFYQDIDNGILEGMQPFPRIQESLSCQLWELKEGDYLTKVFGKFKMGEMTQIGFKSKFGKQIYLKNPEENEGEAFNFEGKENEIPSCFFGAYLKRGDTITICHLGCEFVSDW